ncbi:MAG: hypothetical protein OSB70_15450, partial [Myxococcota bacterium]|nr:hypothetical protein [Myxococcota bacterium]
MSYGSSRKNLLTETKKSRLPFWATGQFSITWGSALSSQEIASSASYLADIPVKLATSQSAGTFV